MAAGNPVRWQPGCSIIQSGGAMRWIPTHRAVFDSVGRLLAHRRASFRQARTEARRYARKAQRRAKRTRRGQAKREALVIAAGGNLEALAGW